MRTIIDLPEHQLRILDDYRKSRKISRAEAIRRAVAAFLPTEERGERDYSSDPAFGSSRRYSGEDSVEFVRRLRNEWE